MQNFLVYGFGITCRTNVRTQNRHKLNSNNNTQSNKSIEVCRCHVFHPHKTRTAVSHTGIIFVERRERDTFNLIFSTFLAESSQSNEMKWIFEWHTHAHAQKQQNSSSICLSIGGLFCRHKWVYRYRMVNGEWKWKDSFMSSSLLQPKKILLFNVHTIHIESNHFVLARVLCQ